MKIAYITMDFPVKSETFACNDVRKLLERGHHVDVYSLMVSTDEKKSMLRSRRLQGLTIKYFSKKWADRIPIAIKYSSYFIRHFLFTLSSNFDSPKKRLKHLYYALPCLYHFENSIKDSDYDVIHFFWGHYPLVLGDLLMKYRPKQNFTVFLGAVDLSYGLPITKKIAPRVNTIFTHSRTNLSALRQLGISNDRIRVIYRGVDIEYLQSFPRLEKDENMWVTSGRLLSSKRFDLSMNFFASALRHRPDLKLRVIGSGPAEDDLRELAKSLSLESHVEFVPWLPQEELLRTLSRADALLFFSEKPGEKLPNIVKEAMYFECLCFVGPKSGCDELIEHGTHGLILNENTLYTDVIDEHQIAQLNRMRSDAKRRIIENFSLNVAMEQYLRQWQCTDHLRDTS